MPASAQQFSGSANMGATRYGAAGRSYSSRGTGRYVPFEKDYVAKFYENLRRWESETTFLSDIGKITQHECYQVLVELAPHTTRQIASELTRGISRLVWVLEDAFDTQPYADEDVGKMSAMAQGWIEWLNRRGSVG